jgi:putative membrane protein
MRTRTGIAVFSVLTVLTLTALSAFATGRGITASDAKFIQAAASGGKMEVELGKYAESHAQMQVVKDFGSRMATDHQKAGDELADLAKKKDVKVPDEMTAEHKAMVDTMKQLTGADFDKRYMTDMVKDHVKDIAAFKHAVRTTKDDDLKAWASLTLPVLEEHLRLAKAAAAAVNSGRDVTREGKK